MNKKLGKTVAQKELSMSGVLKLEKIEIKSNIESNEYINIEDFILKLHGAREELLKNNKISKLYDKSKYLYKKATEMSEELNNYSKLINRIKAKFKKNKYYEA